MTDEKKVDIPEGTKGDWKVEKFEITKRVQAMSIFNLQHRLPEAGTCTLLRRGGVLVMSDTSTEIQDLWEPIYEAKGSCLIHGLGLGVLLTNILCKPEVTDVTVIEISQDLIDLIGPHFQDPRVTIICADAFTWKPPKGKRYQLVWHDIWDTICGDNLPEMHKLHRRYGRRTDWQGSWARYECERNR